MHIFPYIRQKTAGCAGSRSLRVFDVVPPEFCSRLQLYLIPGAAQDDVDDSVDVGDVDFAITVHVGSNSVIIST